MPPEQGQGPQGPQGFQGPAGGGGSPGGSNGALQYNNSSSFGGSAATITSGGAIVIPAGGSLTINDTAGNTDLVEANTTTANSGTTNASPTHGFQSNYWTGAVSAVDQWSLGSSLAAGTNGASSLTVVHSGSSGAPQIIIPTNNSATVPTLAFSGNTSTGLGNQTNSLNFISGAASPTFNFCNTSGSAFSISKTSGSYVQLAVAGANQLFLTGNISTAVTTPSVVLGQSSNNFTGTGAGTQVAVSVGATNGTVTFAPTSGSTNFTAFQVLPTINQTGGANGTCTDILSNSTETALNGTHNLIDLQVGSTSKFKVSNGGVITIQGTAGITQTAEAVGTLATIGGIVTTFTAVSDERLKNFAEYKGGLDTILAIDPIAFRWNDEGSKISGQATDRDLVGFSAQNIKEAIPEAVHVTRDGYLGLDDRPIISALVNAVKQLSAKIAELEAR